MHKWPKSSLSQYAMFFLQARFLLFSLLTYSIIAGLYMQLVFDFLDEKSCHMFFNVRQLFGINVFTEWLY